MIKQGFTDPKLYDCKADLSKEWYVGFKYTCAECGVRKPYQVRLGINYGTTIGERRTTAAEVIKLVKSWLKSGWNPHHENVKAWVNRAIQPREQKKPEDNLPAMPLIDALDWGYNKRKSSLVHKSQLDYEVIKAFAIDAAKEIKLDQKPVGQFTKKHIKLLLDEMGRQRQAFYDDPDCPKRFRGKKFTGNTYNKYKRILSGIFTELEEFEAVPFNPCYKIKKREEIKTNIHRHAYAAEREVIKSTLWEASVNFYIFLATFYMTGIRPKELLCIKIEDTDWFNQCFDLGAEGDQTKNKEARKVPIPDALMPYLEMLRLQDYQPTDYIFSYGFKPGPVQIHRNRATELWKELIKDGLGINVSMYSFKGLGGEDKRRAGIAAAAVSNQYGHSNMKTTMIYLEGEQDRINQDIRKLTPDL